ncbi:MAG: hypothetical protein CVU39_26710 [Chloroflexi bacterium HGW-Chloroflexi-10]|nr:MAG: hypothetical protein CVU39_26710 [Chloroflexi bacterium HGW-Chloroflexi-10]
MSLPFARAKSITDQVDAVLRDRIRDKTYPPGGKLPSENDLSAEFGVSRSTVHTVLTRLAQEGLLLRKHGEGTYVNLRLHGVKSNWGGLWEFSELIESNGYTAGIETLAAYTRPATNDECVALNLADGETVTVLERLFFADDHPVILVNNAIPNRLIHPGTEVIPGKHSLRQILHEYCQVNIAYAISQVSTSKLGAPLSITMQKPLDTVMLNIRIVFYDVNNQPIATGSSYYDDSRIKLRLVQAWN